MEDKAHHIQDACEIYAVAVLQSLAEAAGLAVTRDSGVKMDAFRDYSRKRNLGDSDFSAGTYKAYKESVDRHMPVFFRELCDFLGNSPVDFIDVEAEYRNRGLKGDFLILSPDRGEISVSLKNYRGGATRPQCSSGTFNSFAMNFLFESSAVGRWLDPSDGDSFSARDTEKRDSAVRFLGYDALVPLLHELDALNQSIKARFVYSDDFEFLDESLFDAARKSIGDQGFDVMLRYLDHLPADIIKRRLLDMTGLDGSEEMLLIDPERMTNSITRPRFRRLRFGVQDDRCHVVHAMRGKGIGFDFVLEGETLVQVDVPFTINKNGAWISGTPYDGVRFHAKEGIDLAYGQRRPKKSKELATSINTYVNFGAAGIFETDAASPLG